MLSVLEAYSHNIADTKLSFGFETNYFCSPRSPSPTFQYRPRADTEWRRESFCGDILESFPLQSLQLFVHIYQVRYSSFSALELHDKNVPGCSRNYVLLAASGSAITYHTAESFHFETNSNNKKKSRGEELALQNCNRLLRTYVPTGYSGVPNRRKKIRYPHFSFCAVFFPPFSSAFIRHRERMGWEFPTTERLTVRRTFFPISNLI